MDSFVFYKEWRDAIASLAELERLSIYEAIIDYACDGTEPQLEPTLMMAFKFIKGDIDRNEKKWEDIRKKRSEAGKKHKGNQYTRLEQKEQVSQNGTNGTVNVNDNVDVNGNVNVDVHEDKSSLCVFNESHTHTTNEDLFRYAIIMLRKGVAECISEARDFINHYEKYSWISTAGKPITNRMAAARAWKPRREPKIDGTQATIYTDLLYTCSSVPQSALTDFVHLTLTPEALSIRMRTQKSVDELESVLTANSSQLLSKLNTKTINYYYGNN